MSKPVVAIVMGSESDMPVMEEAAKVLDNFKIPYKLLVASAHRSPRLVQEFARSAEASGIEVIIAGAGGAAHLPGVIASETVLPVIGVPIDSSPLRGIDALLSIGQMPSGVPVATMAIGTAGAKNAALFAIAILARKDPVLNEKIKRFREDMARAIERKMKGAPDS